MSSSPDRREFLRTSLAGGLGLGLAVKSAARPAEAASACARAALPQDDPDPAGRLRQLERTRGRYTWDYERIPSVPMVERLPPSDVFSLPFLRQAVDRALDLVENFLTPAERRLAGGRTWRSVVEALATGGNRDTATLRTLLDVAARAARSARGDGRPSSVEDYGALFRTIERPAIAETFQDDRVFARQRVAGANPLVIRRVAALDDRFPVTDALLRSVVAGDSLDAAAAEGRLYLADYHELDDVARGLFRGVPKFVAAPLALFVVEKGTGDLLPVAIQCAQQPGPAHPIFTRHDGVAWLLAKTVVQVADANVHEAMHHLGRTHLFIEPFVIATERQLAANHPLRLLLRPHFEGTLAINEFAHDTLLAPGGFVDDLLAGTLEASMQLAARAVQTWRVDEAPLPLTLRARGVDDAGALPQYPYRDDALLYWNAIRAWVDEYLRAYYRSDADLLADFELAAWQRELVAADGGRVAGFGSIGGLDGLVDAVTLVLFTSSVQHAAVNFPQFDLMTYVPNMPLAGFTEAPASRSAGEQDFLDLLPPLSSAREQILILYLLGTVHHTTLGMYSADQICDPLVRRPLRQFRAELDRVGRAIDARNRVRAPYPFLDRAGIPQSINI
jgi:arachidonate 15-lipoxygenase